MKINTQIIIPMSGEGKRFLDYGYKDPKPFIKIIEKPMIHHVIEMFSGFKDYLFICNEKHISKYNGEDIIRRKLPNAKVVLLKNNKLGPVVALKKFENLINDKNEIIVSYCDFFSKFEIQNFLNFARKNKSDGAIVVYTGFHPHMLGNDHYAYLKTKGNSRVVYINEKKQIKKNKMSEIASNGIYYFKNGKILKSAINKYLEQGPKINGEYYISILFNFLIKNKKKVNYYLVDNMCQWGTPHDFELFRNWVNYFKKKLIRNKKKVKYDDISLLVPMAGKGLRFLKKGFEIPKPFLKIDDNFMFLKAIDDLPNFDKNHFIVQNSHIVKFNFKLLKEKFKNSKFLSLKKITDGQARTCMLGIKYFKIASNSKLFISACDNGSFYSDNKLSKLILDEKVDVIVWSFRNNPATKINPNIYSWLQVDKNKSIKQVYVKNINNKDPLKTHAIVGTFFFRKTEFFLDGFNANIKRNIRTNGEFYVDEIINRNIEMNLNVKVFEIDNYISWGTPEDYKTYNYWSKFFKNNLFLF
jgi:NDP-sugar pyrophosphorylase family protein